MLGADHYREAERITNFAELNAEAHDAEWYANAMRAAQVHATLAHAAAVVEASAASALGIHIGVPNPSDPELGDRPYPGTPWGRAFYGDRHLTANDKDS